MKIFEHYRPKRLRTGLPATGEEFLVIYDDESDTYEYSRLYPDKLPWNQKGWYSQYIVRFSDEIPPQPGVYWCYCAKENDWVRMYYSKTTGRFERGGGAERVEFFVPIPEHSAEERECPIHVCEVAHEI